LPGVQKLSADDSSDARTAHQHGNAIDFTLVPYYVATGFIPIGTATSFNEYILAPGYKPPAFGYQGYIPNAPSYASWPIATFKNAINNPDKGDMVKMGGKYLIVEPRTGASSQKVIQDILSATNGAMTIKDLPVNDRYMYHIAGGLSEKNLSEEWTRLNRGTAAKRISQSQTQDTTVDSGGVPGHGIGSQDYKSSQYYKQNSTKSTPSDRGLSTGGGTRG